MALRISNYWELVAAIVSVEQDNQACYQSRETISRVSVSGGPSASGGPQRSNRRNRNQGQISGEIVSGGSSSSRSDMSGAYRLKCHHCGQIGHIKRNCPNQNRPSTQ